ncbi:MAG: DUF6036 family nucleotidyltransferase [Solirubrobacteraceae bacterium]
MSSISGPLDAGELTAALNRHAVDYVVIGGVALQAHGHVRTTQDLDIIAAWTPENTQRLASALRELGARLRGIDAGQLGIDLDSPQQLYQGGNFLTHTRHGDLDVFAVDQTPGAPKHYEDLRQRAIPVEIRGITLLIAHPEDLIRMKSAAARFRDRPEAKRRQDLDDITVLNRVLEIDTDQTDDRGPNRRLDPSPLARPGPSRYPRRKGPTLEK